MGSVQQINQSDFVINPSLKGGLEEGLCKIIETGSSRGGGHDAAALKAAWFATVLGTMVVISDDRGLYLLEFADQPGLEKEIAGLKRKQKANIIPGETSPIARVKDELGQYFLGGLTFFDTPFHIIGSDFQKKAWSALRQVPYGHTRSYLDQAKIMGNVRACRAAANANNANQLAIIVPCHRIIGNNGSLGGYKGGRSRKEWLINHEKRHA